MSMKDNSFGNIRPESIKKVYREIASHNGITRADLAKNASVSLMTISKITDFFHFVRMTAEFEKRSSKVGRKPSLVHINRKDYGCIVDLSVSHFKAYFFAPGNKPKGKLQYSCDTGLHFEENAQIFMKKLADHLKKGVGRSHCLGVALLYPRAAQNSAFFEESKQILAEAIKSWYPKVRIFEMDYVDASAQRMLVSHPELLEKTYLYFDMRYAPEASLVSHGKIVRGAGVLKNGFSDAIIKPGISLAEILRIRPYSVFLKEFTHLLLPALLVLSPDTLVIDTHAFHRSRVVIQMMRESIAEEMGTDFRLPMEFIAADEPFPPAVLYAMDQVTDAFLNMVIEKTRF